MSKSESTLLRAFVESAARLERFFKNTNVNWKYSLTIREAAEYTGLGVDKIRDAVTFGEIEAFKPQTDGKGKAILLRRRDVEKYVERYSLRIPKEA